MATDKYNCSENLWSKILLSARIILFYPGLFGTVIYLIYAVLYTQRDGHHFFYFYSFQKWWPSQHSSLFNFSYSAACIRRIPFHRSPQTPSMTKGSLRSPCSPQDTSRWHSQRQTPAPVKISRKAQQMMTVSTLFVIQFFFFFVLSNKVFLLYLLYLSIEIFDFIYFIK